MIIITKTSQTNSLNIESESAFPCPLKWFRGKESTCNAGDAGSIPGSGRSPGGGNDNPLYSFPSGSDNKEFTCNARDLGLVPGSGRSPVEGNGYPLQHSCLENSMDRGAWWATVQEVTNRHNWVTFRFCNNRIQECSMFTFPPYSYRSLIPLENLSPSLYWFSVHDSHQLVPGHICTWSMYTVLHWSDRTPVGRENCCQSQEKADFKITAIHWGVYLPLLWRNHTLVPHQPCLFPWSPGSPTLSHTPHICTHTCTCAHTHACTHTHMHHKRIKAFCAYADKWSNFYLVWSQWWDKPPKAHI